MPYLSPRSRALLALILLATCPAYCQSAARAMYRVDVNMVMLTFSVTDKNGNAVTGLQPSDVRVLEDGVPQKVVSFAEGSTLFRLAGDAPPMSGTGIFLLFDTSNRMYTRYPYVRDAIADFIRQLAPADSAAIYTFSRNLFRAASLTPDHVKAAAGLDNISAGDDSALFNAILLTLRDAALVAGRKAIVVFSNSADNASMLSPGDVARVAEDEGIPIYVISTRNGVQDPTYQALQYLTARTGGKLYYARNWQSQAAAFRSIRNDIRTSYTICYYPEANSNTGFRNIAIEIVSPAGRSYHVTARPGYQPRKDTVNHTN